MSETCVCGTQVVRMSTERMADGSFRVTTLPVAVFPAANVHVVEDGTEGTGLYESRQTSGHANRAGQIDLRTSGSPYTVEELTWSEHTADRCAAIARDRETT